MNKKIRFFEEVSSNAHVALNTMQFDGWLIRFANGYTKRANSISVIYPSAISFEDKVPYCEEIYKKANLPCVFKLTEDDNELNEYLEAHGYEAVTPTDVMVLDLKDKTFQNCASAAIEHGYMLLQNVVVGSEYRGHGYGRAVCESLIAQAKENSAHHTYL